MEPDPLRLCVGVDEPPCDIQVGELGCQRVEVFGGLSPIRAVVEVQQGDVHDPTINLLPRKKVKAIVSGQGIVPGGPVSCSNAPRLHRWR